MMIMSSTSVCVGGHGLSCIPNISLIIFFDSLPLKRKKNYYINTVQNQEFVNNTKQSPLSQVGINTSTLFCGVPWILKATHTSVAVDFRMRATRWVM